MISYFMRFSAARLVKGTTVSLKRRAPAAMKKAAMTTGRSIR